MRGRNEILADVRANKPKFSAPAPDVPNYDDHYPTDTAGLQARFIETLEKMGGAWAEPEADEPPEATMRRALADKLDANSIIASNVPEIKGNRRVRADDKPASLHDVDVAILRARFGVAETGSVCFTEAELTVNAVAYLAQHLVILLDPADDRNQPAPRLSARRLQERPLHRLPHRPLGHRGYRRRAGARGTGSAVADDYSGTLIRNS